MPSGMPPTWQPKLASARCWWNAMPLLLARRAAVKAGRPTPLGATTPSPVTTTRISAMARDSHSGDDAARDGRPVGPEGVLADRVRVVELEQAIEEAERRPLRHQLEDFVAIEGHEWLRSMMPPTEFGEGAG